MKTCYDILGITPLAPQEIVSAVYRAWMKALKIHPDLGGDEELAKQINSAYETLKDPERRARYDAGICSGKNTKEEIRRRAPRADARARIAFCIPPDGRWLPAETVDASSLGLKVHTVEILHEGLHVSVAFPECAAPAVEAEVRWVKRLGGDGVWRCESGLEFFNPVPDILKRLNII